MSIHKSRQINRPTLFFGALLSYTPLLNINYVNDKDIKELINSKAIINGCTNERQK